MPGIWVSRAHSLLGVLRLNVDISFETDVTCFSEGGQVKFYHIFIFTCIFFHHEMKYFCESYSTPLTLG